MRSAGRVFCWCNGRTDLFGPGPRSASRWGFCFSWTHPHQKGWISVKGSPRRGRGNFRTRKEGHPRRQGFPYVFIENRIVNVKPVRSQEDAVQDHWSVLFFLRKGKTGLVVENAHSGTVDIEWLPARKPFSFPLAMLILSSG